MTQGFILGGGQLIGLLKQALRAELKVASLLIIDADLVSESRVELLDGVDYPKSQMV